MDVMGVEQLTNEHIAREAVALEVMHPAEQQAVVHTDTVQEHIGLLDRMRGYAHRVGATALTTVAFLGVPAAAGAKREGIPSHQTPTIAAAHDFGRKKPSEQACMKEALSRPLNISLVDLNKAKVTQRLSFTTKALRKGCKEKRGMRAKIEVRSAPDKKYGIDGQTRSFFSNKRFQYGVTANLFFRKCGYQHYDKHNVMIRAGVTESYPDPLTHQRVSKTHYSKPRNLCAGK